jgi:general secretion pathway protein A
MYLEHFKLHTLPFRLSPDPHFLFLSKQHSRAKAYMESTVWFTDGFVVITGEIGAGKTTLIETFLSELPPDVVVAQVNQTRVSSMSFLQMLLMQFGISSFHMRKSEILVTLSQFLTDQFSAGKKVLLVIDEAQNLSVKVLEEIRMLSGIETTTEKVLRIIIAGQPELNQKLNSPELVQLAQRIRFRFHLSSLTENETVAYIKHRLQIAGSDERTIFADETFATIYQYTSGMPRLINTLCDTAMMAAYSEDRYMVSPNELANAIEELQWQPAVPERAAQINAALVATADVDPSPFLGRIVLAYDGRTIREVALHPGRLVIGRTVDNDLQVESSYVSRHHCQIVTRPEGTTIEDLNSSNGVYIGSRRVRKYTLRHGDIVKLGRHEVTYISEPAGQNTVPRNTAANIGNSPK